MAMTSGLRKFVLTAHVTSSVGWLGAVAAFLALAIAGLTRQDSETVRAAYVAMEVVGWFVIVPFCLASFSTGVVQSLGTEWGLFRHYWVVVKFMWTVVGTLLLLLHLQPTSRLASTVPEALLLGADLNRLRIQMVADAGAALIVLMLTTAVSVYKPWGRTPYGRQSPWGRYVLIAILGFLLLVAAVHLAGGGLGGH